jgi:hypothetical protein
MTEIAENTEFVLEITIPELNNEEANELYAAQINDEDLQHANKVISTQNPAIAEPAVQVITVNVPVETTPQNKQQRRWKEVTPEQINEIKSNTVSDQTNKQTKWAVKAFRGM